MYFSYPSLIRRPRSEEPPRISACTLYFQKLESLAHILSLRAWVYLHSNLCSGPQKTHLFGRSRSSKVDDFGTNRKRVLWSYLAPFLRYADLMAKQFKNCLYFSYLSHSAPSLPMFTLEFPGEVNHEATRVMGQSSSKDRMIVA